MEEGRARMKLNIYRLVNLIDAFMLFTVSLEFFIKDFGAGTAHYFEYSDILSLLEALSSVFMFFKM